MFCRTLKKLGIEKLYYKMLYKHKKGKKLLSLSTQKSIEFLSLIHEDCHSSCIRENGIDIGAEYDLDIIIPAFNAEKYIEECISSVLSQKTKYKYRVILVDDGSTDCTPQMVDRYSDDTRIMIIHQDNGGHSQARNTGLNSLNSKYVTFLDSDDCFTLGAIDVLLDYALENDADSVEGAYEVMGTSGKQKRIVEHKTGWLNAEKDYYGFPWGKVYRSSYFSKVQFPTKYWYEDSVCRQILFPLLRKSYGIDIPVYRYRENRKGISHTSRGNVKAIDSLWITFALYRDRQRLGLQKSQEYYHYILRMVALTYKRTEKLNIEIQEMLFVAFAEFLDCNFSEYCCKLEEFKDLEASIKNRDFGLYSFWAKLW